MTGQSKKVIRDLALVHHDSSSVTMETGKPGLASAPVHINAVAAQTEKRMDVQAPLTAVYIHTVPALPAQPYPQLPAAAREPATLHLAMPPLYSKETLPFLTLHIAGGLHSQPGLNLAAASPAAKPKSAGKHVCPHCGRDCMKPSVLEKHLRCHTGERPYPCTTCGISFKTQSNLYKHKRTQAHARLSSESEQSSLGSLGSLDSMSSSRETFTSSLSLDDRSGESSSIEKDATLPGSEINCPASAAKTCSTRTQGSMNEQNEWTSTDQKTKEPNESAKVTLEGEKQRMENERPLTTVSVSRHLPLKRQEATLSSKQWKSSVSRGKSQNHESTDSGFSESSDHYPSPSSMLHDHSMDSLTESTKEHLEESTSTKTASQQSGQEPKDTAREQEQKTLEERISKLISQNTAVVEDKQLENVRPRKTVLSKQGSIDLPVPYTYKDSFHFDMKISKTNVGLQRNRKPGLYSSVPTQHSTTVEHAPLTRSNSLPFSVTLLQPERSTPTSSCQGDYVTLVRRGSSGQINPTGFAIRPVNQQSSTHRPLVRQTAVDCNHATDGLFMNLSVEEACSGSLSCDGDSGDICGEPSNRKFRRKKAQKFAYNKWYMYGGGTFKKLYSAEKCGDDSGIKGKKGLTNPENEVAQGLQNKLPAVHKETVATTSSTANITSSSARACHPDCPSAQLSHVSAVDFNLKTSQPQTPCSSLKNTLRRNLSSSILPLPLIGSLVSHKTDSMIRAKDGGLNNEEKHTESSSQLCGAHLPSDRKKQKTDDKMICPLEMETDQNTLTHPPPSVTGSAPQHDTNLSYISLQKNLKQSQLKGTLFPPCIINANTPSVSTSPVTPVPAAAKTSFLPKYQLKLPNAAELDSNPLSDVVDKPTTIDGRSFTSALASSHTEQTPLSVTTSERRCSNPVTSLLMHSCDIKKANVFISTQGQVLLPCTATTLCEAATSSLNTNATSSLATVHRQFAATTKTTTCLRDYQAGFCSTSIQLSKSAGVAGPVQFSGPGAPMVANFSATPTITTANNPTSAAAIAPVSQGKPNPNHPLPHTQVSPVSDQFVGSNTPVVPCHIVPFDQTQPAAQNVFHVHTADLQICLQIISDEQLALIEPQIERHASSVLSQSQEMTAEAPEGIQSTTQSSVTTKNKKMDHQQPGHNTGLDKSESLPTLNTEGIKTPLTVQFGKAEPNPHLTEHSNSTQAMVSAESRPPKTLSLSQRPHKYGHVNKVTETQSTVGDVMSTAASLKGVKFGRSETLEEEHTPPLTLSAEERLLPDMRVSQGGLVSQTLPGQHKLSMTSLSPSAANQNSPRSGTLGNKSQHKPKNQGPMCNVGMMEAKGETSTYKGSRVESGGTHSTLQAGFSQASGAACAEKLSGLVSSFSVNRYKSPRQLNPQASIYCSHPEESTLSKALNSPQQEYVGGDRVSPVDTSVPSQEMTLNESLVKISSTHSEKQLVQFTSMASNMQVENPKELPAVLTSIQRPTTGHMERDSMAGCAGEKEPVTQGHTKTPGPPDRTEWRPKQRQEAKETETDQCVEGQGGGGGGMDKTHEPSGQRDKAKSNCKYTCLQHMAKPEGEDRQAKADSSKNSWLSEQHLLHPSQTVSGMSEYSQQSPQQVPGTSNDLNLPTSSSQTSLCNSLQPPLETNNFSFSQQHWESSVIHNQQTQILCKSNLSQHVKPPAQFTETQNASPKIESRLQQTFSHQDQKQTSITSSIQEGDDNGGYTQSTSEAHKSMSHDLKTSHSSLSSQISHSVHVSRATAVLTVDTQASNNNVPEDNTELPSKSFTYPQPEDYHDTKDKAPHDYHSPSSNPARPDITGNKYQPFFFAGQLHGCQSSDCLTSGVRPVQSCQDYTEDTSSSDDEGKLIIEL